MLLAFNDKMISVMLLKKSAVMRFPRQEKNTFALQQNRSGICLYMNSFARNWMRPVSWETWEYDLDTYNHCIAVLQRYFTGNPSTDRT
jgi:hypothetical protein